MAVNVVLLMGNLCSDPDLKYTTGGKAVCTLRVASNHQYTTAGGEKREEALFVDVVTWGKTAEAASEYLAKGSKVLVEGRLTFNEWTDRAGQRRHGHRVHANFLQFLSHKKANGAAAAPAPDGYNAGNEDVPF